MSQIHHIVCSQQNTEGSVMQSSQCHTTTCSWIHHISHFCCCLQCKTSTPLHFQRPAHHRTVLRQLFCVAVFAERELGNRNANRLERKMSTPKGLPGACDSDRTNDRPFDANTTPRNNSMKLQNLCNDFQKPLCLLNAQIEEIEQAT